MSKKRRLKFTQMEIEWLEPGDPGYRSNPDQNLLIGEKFLQDKLIKKIDKDYLHNASDMEQKSNI